jgi:predicted HTH transcriptional regulator
MFEFVLIAIGFLGGAVFMWLWHKCKYVTSTKISHWDTSAPPHRNNQNKTNPEQTNDIDKLEKIMNVLETFSHITCDDVENMFGVAHDTAMRYLNELEKLGRLTHAGSSNSGMIYKKK